jgi:GNAT superfamily N-acetyltransferase
MLLPQAFEGGGTPEAFLAWDHLRGAIAGLAVFHRAGRETVRLQVITIRTYRRQGIGLQLVRRVCERALERGDQQVCTHLDLGAHPDVEPFLCAAGFRRGTRLLRLEGDIALLREQVLEFRTKLTGSGKIPAGARVVDTRGLPVDIVHAAFQELALPLLRAQPAMTRFTISDPAFDALLLLAGGRAAGLLIGVRGSVCATARVDLLAVAADFQGGWGWANMLLLGAALDRAWEAGSRRARFETEETNWMVLRHLSRIAGVTTATLARFTRPC